MRVVLLITIFFITGQSWANYCEFLFHRESSGVSLTAFRDDDLQALLLEKSTAFRELSENPGNQALIDAFNQADQAYQDKKHALLIKARTKTKTTGLSQHREYRSASKKQGASTLTMTISELERMMPSPIFTFDCSEPNDEAQLIRFREAVIAPMQNDDYQLCLSDCDEASNWSVHSGDYQDNTMTVSVDCQNNTCDYQLMSLLPPPDIQNMNAIETLAYVEDKFGRDLIRPSQSTQNTALINTIYDETKAMVSNPNLCSLMLMRGDHTQDTITCDEPVRDADGQLVYDANGDVVFQSVTRDVPIIASDLGEAARPTTRLSTLEYEHACVAQVPMTTTIENLMINQGSCETHFPKDDYTCTFTKTLEARHCDVQQEVFMVQTSATVDWVETLGSSCGIGQMDGSHQWMTQTNYNKAFVSNQSSESASGMLAFTNQTCPTGNPRVYQNSREGDARLYVQVIPSKEHWQNKTLRLKITMVNIDRGYTQGDQAGKEGKVIWSETKVTSDMNRLMPTFFFDIDLSDENSRNVSAYSKLRDVSLRMGKRHCWSYGPGNIYTSCRPESTTHQFEIDYISSCTAPTDKTTALTNGDYYQYDVSNCSVSVRSRRWENRTQTQTASAIKHTTTSGECATLMQDAPQRLIIPVRQVTPCRPLFHGMRIIRQLRVHVKGQ